MASAPTLDRGCRVRALAADIMLCSRARHFTPKVLFSTQVYKWVPSKLMPGVTLRWWTTIPSSGEQIYSGRYMLQKLGLPLA